MYNERFLNFCACSVIVKMALVNDVSYQFQANVLTSHGAALTNETRTVKLSELGEKEVLIRTKAAGVCHSDVHFWHGAYQIGQAKDEVVTFSERGLTLPIVLGHEIAGEVLAMGATANSESNLVVGDRVLVYPWVGCEKCAVCESGDPQLCAMKSSRDLGFCSDGGFSEIVRVPSHCYLYKLPDNLPYELAAQLPCGALTAYSAIKKMRSIVNLEGEEEVRVGVVGLGGVGQWCLKLLKHMYKDSIQIVGFDISQPKTKQALELGLAHRVFVLDKEKTAKEQVKEFLRMFDNNRFNCWLDFVNATKTFSFCTDLLYKGGVLVCVGLHGGLGQIQLPYLVLHNITITAVHTGSPSSMTELLDMVTNHPLESPPLTIYPQLQATQALQDLDKGLIMGRGILTP